MSSLIIFLTLLGCGFFVGRHLEKKHYRSIMEREACVSFPLTSRRFPETSETEIDRGEMVFGSVVISVDYFKRVLSALINLFGGDLRPYETLLDRARREATLRLVESCPDADEIINLRIETSSISKGSNRNIGCVEVIAYGTAIYHTPRNINSTT